MHRLGGRGTSSQRTWNNKVVVCAGIGNARLRSAAL